jgi:hypothetical protein
VPPSCKMRSSSFSDSAQLLIGVRKRGTSRKRELSRVFATGERLVERLVCIIMVKNVG